MTNEPCHCCGGRLDSPHQRIVGLCDGCERFKKKYATPPAAPALSEPVEPAYWKRFDADLFITNAAKKKAEGRGYNPLDLRPGIGIFSVPVYLAAPNQTHAPAAQGLSKPVAYRAWFDADNGARWLFTLWPEEERLDVTWEPLYTAPPSDSAVMPTHSEQGDLHDSDVKAAQGLSDAIFAEMYGTLVEVRNKFESRPYGTGSHIRKETRLRVTEAIKAAEPHKEAILAASRTTPTPGEA